MAAATHNQWRIIAGEQIFGLQRGAHGWVCPWRDFRRATDRPPPGAPAPLLDDGTMTTLGGGRAIFIGPDGSRLTIGADDLATMFKRKDRARLRVVGLGEGEARVLAA